MLKFWHHRGVLGINARNLLYIRPLNKKVDIQFADNKIRTKQFLSARGVNVARLLGKISHEAELMKFNWDTLPDSFVVKPNAGYGGEGIVVVKDREQDGWLTVKGDFFSQEDLVEHITDILDGRYAITGHTDSAFFEERLSSHPDLGELGKWGLPDIRVIVYNMVPVMAMIRVPTREGQGKANLHLGGIGLGVDLAKGEVTHMLQHNRIIKKHPDFGELKGLRIPYWDQVLLLATQIQQLITLGYLAVDVVIDVNKGPTLLEINARAGLAVQTANLAPLRERLDRVTGIKVQTPEKGVRMAKDLFGGKVVRIPQGVAAKTVIGLEEEVTLNLKHGTTVVLASMNPSADKNFLESGLFKKIAHNPSDEKLTLGYTLMGKRGKTVFLPAQMAKAGCRVIFGKKVLADFFLDVTKNERPRKIPRGQDTSATRAQQGDRERERWTEIDHQLERWDRALGLIAQVRPRNLEGERKKFFMSSSYQPQFEYRRRPEQLDSLLVAAQKLKIDVGSPLGRLFEDKRHELILKAQTIAVIGDDRHFPAQSDRLIGLPPEAIIRRAQQALADLPKKRPIKRPYTAHQAAQDLQRYLKERGISNWEVALRKDLISRCVIGKNNLLLLKEDEHFSRQDIDKLIAHEIEIHVYCTENGKLQPYQIFHRGTAGYLRTQEGLAVYHQNQVISGGTREAIIGFNSVLWARSDGFRELFEKLLHFSASEEEAWKAAVKVKRGLSDTGKPGAFCKNMLYYWGYCEIDEYVKGGGVFEDLFLGKFELSQMELIKSIPGVVAAKFMPKRQV
ncbi:MAG: DUF1704 domain-containing protein [bacterium]|nr:DUF1704 domain-containing protein [bacterium]